jgi:hypothetical protein
MITATIAIRVIIMMMMMIIIIGAIIFHPSPFSFPNSYISDNSFKCDAELGKRTQNNKRPFAKILIPKNLFKCAANLKKEKRNKI